MIKCVIFDLDGTLLDTSQGILESVSHTIEVMGFQKISDEKKKSFIGPPLKKAFIDIYGCSEETALEAVKVFRAHYQAGAVLHARPYDGIAELCRRLSEKGIKLGVATNKPQRFADALLQEYGLMPYFGAVCGADEGGSFTKTDQIRACIEKMGATNTETVLIGDTDNDAVGAAQAGVLFVAVMYGFGFRKKEDLEKCLHIGFTETPLEIERILLLK